MVRSVAWSRAYNYVGADWWLSTGVKMLLQVAENFHRPSRQVELLASDGAGPCFPAGGVGVDLHWGLSAPL